MRRLSASDLRRPAFSLLASLRKALGAHRPRLVGTQGRKLAYKQVRFGRSATGCFQVELWSRAKVQERRDFGSPAESRGVAGKTPSHGVASKCWGGVLNP